MLKRRVRETPVVAVVPTPASVSQIGRRQPESVVEQGRSMGAVIAPSVDADFGDTRAAEAAVIDRLAAAEVAGVVAGFQEKRPSLWARLCGSFAHLKALRRETEKHEASLATAVVHQTNTADALSSNHAHHRFASGLGRYATAIMVAVAVADVALAELCLELFAMSAFKSWLLASAVGVAQLVVLHRLAEMSCEEDLDGAARRQGASRGSFRVSRRTLILVMLAAPVIGLAIMMAWLRADVLAMQNASMGAADGLVGWGVSFATMLAMQMVLNSLAVILGLSSGSPSVKAALAAQRAVKRGERRVSSARRAETRQHAVFLHGFHDLLGWYDYTSALVTKIWTERRASSAAFLSKLGEAGGAEIQSVFSQLVQLGPVDAESEKSVAARLATIQTSRSELIAWATDMGFAEELALPIPGQAQGSAEVVEEALPAVSADASGNGNGNNNGKRVVRTHDLGGFGHES